MSALEKEIKAIQQLNRDVAVAAMPFQSRWSFSDLEKINPELHVRFRNQLCLWVTANRKGEDWDEIKAQGQAMIRGWNAIAMAMEEAKQPDTTFMLGQAKNGLRVAIGTKVSLPRVLEVEGQRCIFLTPDEVANILEITENLKTVVAIKAQWPGAEICGEHEGRLDRYPDEPAKED